MAKTIKNTQPAVPSTQNRVLVDAVVRRNQDKDSKNYATFGMLPVLTALGNKAEVIIGRDGAVLVSKEKANGATMLRVTITLES